MAKKTGDLFTVQPAFCRAPLPIKEIPFTPNPSRTDSGQLKWHRIRTRALFFDPTDVYSRLHTFFNPFQRNNPISINAIFLQGDKNLCSCGCGVALTGRRTSWANEECALYASYVREVFYCRPDWIYSLLSLYSGEVCTECGRTADEVYNQDIKNSTNTNTSALKVDHIHPVKLGGGGSWLPNYQLLCHKCHVPKTCEDFGWKQKQPNSQLPLL
jgi:5-methylcytosine-specific restriction endonuclease McrA